MNALFIGRFQPFHNGHLIFLKNIYNQYEKVIIGIGSSQYKDTKDNPFSYDERKLMIEKSLEDEGINNYSIVAIPDIHDPPNWVSHVLTIVSDFDVVLSNNTLTKKLFTEKNFIVKDTNLIKREIYSGKEIRKRMISNNSWEELVPKVVEDIIKNINGVKRVKNIC